MIAGAENADDDGGVQQTKLLQKVTIEQTKLGNFPPGRALLAPGVQHKEPDLPGEALTTALAHVCYMCMMTHASHSDVSGCADDDVSADFMDQYTIDAEDAPAGATLSPIVTPRPAASEQVSDNSQQESSQGVRSHLQGDMIAACMLRNPMTGTSCPASVLHTHAAVCMHAQMVIRTLPAWMMPPLAHLACIQTQTRAGEVQLLT